MNNGSCCNGISRKCLIVVGIVLGLLLGGVIVRRMVRSEPVRGPREARAEERAKNMHDYRDALAKETGSVLLSKETGTYRIPIEHAMEITAREWQNPEAAKKTLVERAAKANPPPPPPPPAPKSPFE